jgi:transposase
VTIGNREQLKRKMEAFYLPAYAPELNPAEYIWAHLKQHELANLCPAISGACLPTPVLPCVRCNADAP